VVEEKQQTKQKVSFDKSRLELLPDGGYRLLGQKCLECDTVVPGRHLGCLKCQSRRLEDVDLSQKGTLANYSIVQIKPSSEWKGPVPYALGEVILPEGPAVTSLIMGQENLEELKVGMEMKLGIEKADEDEEGNKTMIYVWKPAKT